jgi:phosphatidylglycerophosphate synthase
MGKLLEGYWQSLKPREVEEPVDVWLHRPIAFILAKLLLPTSISPNVVTAMSILLGLLALVAMLSSFPNHMPIAGLCIFASAVADCADGQLARMRGTSSALGRMLDGAADLVVSLATVGGGAIVVLRKHSSSTSELLIYAAAIIFTAVTGSFHTSSYDHYKNLYLRLTNPRHQEAEDLETARVRFAKKEGARSIWVRITWPIYLFYLKSQTDYIRMFDPHTTAKFSQLPAYDPQTAATYAKHNDRLMKQWRNWFGFGSMTFGFAVATALDCLEIYLLLRGVLLNCYYFAAMMPQQRHASTAAFSELGPLEK